MLRSIKSAQRKPRLIGLRAATAASATNSQSIGAFEGTFSNDSSDEQLDVSLAKPFARAEVVQISTPGADVAAGGAAIAALTPAASALSISTQDQAAAPDPGESHTLILGFDSEDKHSNGSVGSIRDSLKGTRRNPRLVTGEYDPASGVTISGRRVASTLQATGDVLLTLDRQFRSGAVAVAIPSTATPGAACRIASATAAEINILTTDAANSPADIAFHFAILGFDDADDAHFDHGGSVQTGYRHPRILPLRVDNMSTTIELAVGAELASVVDDGVGQFTITFAEAFKRKPIVLACSAASAAPRLTLLSASATECSLDVSNVSGTLTDSDEVHVLVIGADDETDY